MPVTKRNVATHLSACQQPHQAGAMSTERIFLQCCSERAELQRERSLISKLMLSYNRAHELSAACLGARKILLCWSASQDCTHDCSDRGKQDLIAHRPGRSARSILPGAGAQASHSCMIFPMDPVCTILACSHKAGAEYLSLRSP